MKSPMQLFEYEDRLVRVVQGQDNEPWWVAKDVCGVLGLADTNKAVQGLDEDEKGTNKVLTLGGEQTLLTLSEPGLFKLIFRSNKPNAKAFTHWVTHEVLPALRRTGSYAMPGASGSAPKRPYTRRNATGKVAADENGFPVSLVRITNEFTKALSLAKNQGLKDNAARLWADSATATVTGHSPLALLGIDRASLEAKIAEAVTTNHEIAGYILKYVLDNAEHFTAARVFDRLPDGFFCFNLPTVLASLKENGVDFVFSSSDVQKALKAHPWFIHASINRRFQSDRKRAWLFSESGKAPKALALVTPRGITRLSSVQ